MRAGTITILKGQRRCLPCGCIEYETQGIRCATHREDTA